MNLFIGNVKTENAKERREMPFGWDGTVSPLLAVFDLPFVAGVSASPADDERCYAQQDHGRDGRSEWLLSATGTLQLLL
jgi:hypothetical protein